MVDQTRICETLAYVLRHPPESIGIALDEAGWAEIDALLAGLAAHGHAAYA
jgi:putative RNA 2'-phosphotransferase